MFKIVILGSSSTFPFPRTVTNQMRDYSDIENYQKKFPLHDDLICKLAMSGGKEKRTRASAAIITGEGTILIDAGPDALYQTNKYKVKPDVILINHDHSDAFGGIGFFPGAKVLRETTGDFKPGQELTIYGLSIIPFRVKHAFNVPTVGFKISDGKTKVAYICDLSSLDGAKKWIKDCDMIFADGSNLAQNQPTHLSIIEQLTEYRGWGIKKVWFTHIGHKTLPHDELIRYCRSLYEPTDIVYDGMVLDL